MNRMTLKASMLATALALGFGAPSAFAQDDNVTDRAERSASQVATDAAITAALKAKLLADSRTEGFDINVDTYNGIVTMTGGADTQAAKDAATELANTVDNVVLIKNELVVAADGSAERIAANSATASGAVREAVADATDGVDEEGNNPDLDVDGDVDGTPPGGDAWITSKVKAQLLADARVKGLDIDVDTENQVVTLTGTVETAEARTAAIEIARTTSGVKNVVADALVVQ
ncbi:BON domain-containing protein [Arenimonas composti]|uniref:BON domain-containing protein n=1 Tax=Arenimonas composti TR7-09 = DSM 18010 TaxID=1121013 RepID=A0A091BD31_9GAMM|nr:BON domain-containing protein [Arenimonas composti]KFN48739.1 hypothetical protein P873_13865 [Arenimonas composti TR7-09 = DSM 18010]